jgi:MerR family transcriptional regulator, copper efflux regulator
MERLDDYLRIQEAAAFLGVAPNTLRNWGREEKIPELRHPVNNYRLYRRSDLEELLRQVSRPGRAAGKRTGRQQTGR